MRLLLDAGKQGKEVSQMTGLDTFLRADIGMGMPPLLPFITAVPSRQADQAPEVWLSACLAEKAERLVLTDEHHHPIGVVGLSHLISSMQVVAPLKVPHAQGLYPEAVYSESFPELGNAGLSPGTEASPLSIDPTHLLNEAQILSLGLPIAIAVEKVLTAPEALWVVVDLQQQYVGVVDVARLLATQLSPTPFSPLLGAPGAEPTAQGCALPDARSQTALLTYLGHELKTPLTSLLGLSSLLTNERLGALTPRQMHYVSLMQQHTRRLTALVNAVLDLARLETGTLQIVPQGIDLLEICERALHQARTLSEEITSDRSPSPAVVDWHLPARSLVADALRLGQMLTYLFQFSLRLSAEGSPCPLQVEYWNEWVAFIFMDLASPLTEEATGAVGLLLTGSAPPMMEYADKTGWLELHLTRRLAELHGGGLAAIAYPDGHLRPTLLLPMTPRTGGEPLERLLVLLTDGVTDVELIQQQLAPLHYHLVVTCLPEDTVVAAAHLTPAAVLVHFSSPHSTLALNVLKTDARTRNRPTIALVSPTLTLQTETIPADQTILWPSHDLVGALTTPLHKATPRSTKLTVLYLRAPEMMPQPPLRPDLPTLLHDCGCRVLEVDDLDQASLITRVWRPDAAMLDPAIAHPASYLQGFSHLPELANLALITLTTEATQIAHGLPELTIFPCLIGEEIWALKDAAQVSAWLIQVLHVATA